MFSRSVSLNSESTGCDCSRGSDSDGPNLTPGRRAMGDDASLDDVSIESIGSGFQRFSKAESCNDIAALAGQAESCNDVAALDAGSRRASRLSTISQMDAGFQRFEEVESCNRVLS